MKTNWFETSKRIVFYVACLIFCATCWWLVTVVAALVLKAVFP